MKTIWKAFVIFMTGLATPAGAETIILAAPMTGDPYYAKVADQIFEFHVSFAKRISDRDDVFVLVDEGAYDRYARALGPDRVALAPVPDIWVRDFGTANPSRPVLFRYTAAGQSGGADAQRAADEVQEGLVVIAEGAELPYRDSWLFNDGGNFVDDGAGNAVVSRKFLRDNGLSEEQARQVLREVVGLRHVAFIEADEQGGLEHPDGVVSFVDTNTLIVNSYPEDPGYAEALDRDLRRGLPGVIIHEVVTPYDGSRIHDPRFGSACGLYTNALVTPDRIYLPQFGIPEDETALHQVAAVTSREVVPVPSQQVCFMGGGVRCMSWQLRGTAARRLIGYLEATR